MAEDLQTKRANLLKQIKAKGGKDKAPNLAKQLDDIEGQIRTGRNPGGEAPFKPDASQKQVINDVRGGQNIRDTLGFNKPLSRLGTDVPDDQRKLIEALGGMGDPNSESFVGRRSDETKGVLGRYKDIADQAGRYSADEQASLDYLKGNLARAGVRSADMQSTLDLMKGGLAGLSAPENQALREQAQAEVDRKYRSAVSDIQDRARSSGFKGGAVNAATRNASRDAMNAQADMEQKNLVSNIGIQDTRRNQYADTLSNVEDTEFGQRRLAGNDYAGASNQLETSRFNRMGAATGAYGNAVQGTEDSERARVRQAMGDYGGAINDRNNYFLDTSKVNLGQERTERAADAQSALGFAGQTETERARRKAASGNKRRSGGSSGDGRNSGATGTAATPGQYGPFSSQRDRDLYNANARAYGQPEI